MAKEMMIIFVYDTENGEGNDDISDSLLYFHPQWVPGEQKFALCGQLVGTVQCLKAMFKCPKIISLQSGKFSVTEFGRFILAVGTDRNIADWIVLHRSNTLCNFIRFFHNDLDVMFKQYQDRSKFSTKLYHIFETYQRILMYGGNMFANIPTIQLPKSASNVFLEAIQILQCCQEMDYVLGGTMLYHNKVVASQLSSNLTKRIVLTDPYRIKSPAEIAPIDFQLPLGVQLLQVYIDREDYQDLLEDSTKCRTVFQYLNKKGLSKKQQTKATPTKETVISAMKRDQSIIFSTVPEEEGDHHHSEDHSPKDIIKPMAPKLQNRPKFLNLRCKTTDNSSKMEPSSTTMSTSTSYPNQTSICSTPMTDLSKVVHEKPLSICFNPEKLATPEKSPKTPPSEKLIINKEETPEKEAVNKIEEIKNKINKKVYPLLFNEDTASLKKCLSVWDMNKFAKVESPVKVKKEIRTITDPFFPVFKNDGSIISESLYEYYVNKQVTTFSKECNTTKDPFENFDMPINDKTEKICESENETENDKKPFNEEINSIKENIPKEKRKSLSLPLKSLTSNNSDAPSPVITQSKYSSGVQLTPLISKLSMIASESSGFCSRTTTPGEFKDYLYTPTSNFSFLNNMKLLKQKESKYRTNVSEKLHKAILFVCGQQDMVVTVLLEEQGCNSPIIINKLWETCTEYLGRLERQLRQCLEVYPANNGQSENGEPYSYLCMDPQWDTVQRGGPWGGVELGALTHLHRDFMNLKNITEIILRDDESIIYGHNCGKTEVFYYQSISSNAGLPTPADPMGVVPLKAKRRLERDHSIILL